MINLNNSKNKAVVVFGGSKSGNDSLFVEEAKKLGQELKSSGVEILIYGGSSDGVMGAFASSFKKNGGTVVEISTEDFLIVDRAYGNESKGIADHQIITKGLPARKHLMMTGKEGLSDIRLSKETNRKAIRFLKKIEVIGAVALPGGTGTDDEIYEVIARNQEQSIKASALKKEYNGPSLPLVVVNTKGIFDKVIDTINHKISHGFTNEKDFRHFKILNTAVEAVEKLIEMANIKEESIKKQPKKQNVVRKILSKFKKVKA
ncbi:MAG: LOG family protein YvdD [Alphaproteobacteria bacterium ADurb.Bin438]|nr:MAG: LOG family protein YvdD [Alphaproteobacteria bacterium ADurb.Bin438]